MDKTVVLLNERIKPRRYLWRLDLEKMTGTTQLPDSKMKEIEIELQPMLGRLAVAPRGEEAFAGLWPGDFGGNLDAPEVRPGTTVYLPIFHDGAYFYFGDVARVCFLRFAGECFFLLRLRASFWRQLLR